MLRPIIATMAATMMVAVPPMLVAPAGAAPADDAGDATVRAAPGHRRPGEAVQPHHARRRLHRRRHAEVPRATSTDQLEHAVRLRALEVLPQLPQRLPRRDRLAGVRRRAATPSRPRQVRTRRWAWRSGAAATVRTCSASWSWTNAPPSAYADLVTGTSAANRQIVALANSTTYGGAGGTYATASGGNTHVVADHAARARPLPRRPAGRVRLLPPRRARRRVHRRRAPARSTTPC